MQNIDQTEVLVVGAGPVGMLAALLLAKGGVRARIIDQEPRTATHSYACALHPRTLELLEEVGVAGEAIRLGRRVDTIGLYEGNSRRAQLKLAALPVKFPFVLVLDQGVFEDLLQQKLGQSAHLEVNWNHRLADLRPTRAGAVATVERLAQSAKGYIVPGWDWVVKNQIEVSADFLIGADGRNSLVRQRLDLPGEAAGAPELFAVYEFESEQDPGHELAIVLDPAATSVMWPLGDRRCRWSFQMVPAGETGDFPPKDRSPFVIHGPAGEGDTAHQLQRWLAERAPWFAAGVKEVDWSTRIQFERRLARQFGQDRCWLVGDAAHQTGPVGMQSLNAGMREAADLADRLRKILRDKAPMTSLQSYNHEHRVEWQRMLGLTGAPQPTALADAWTKARAARLPSILPASGPDLNQLLDALGLEFK